jgi:hypothetical protein
MSDLTADVTLVSLSAEGSAILLSTQYHEKYVSNERTVFNPHIVLHYKTTKECGY